MPNQQTNNQYEHFKTWLLRTAHRRKPFQHLLGGGISGAPAPFDRGGVKIALVSYLSQGDYFEAYEAGVARQAKALGVDLRIFQGKQDAANSATRSNKRSVSVSTA